MLRKRIGVWAKFLELAGSGEGVTYTSKMSKTLRMHGNTTRFNYWYSIQIYRNKFIRIIWQKNTKLNFCLLLLCNQFFIHQRNRELIMMRNYYVTDSQLPNRFYLRVLALVQF